MRVRFDPRSAEIGPFPTDFLTVPDTEQITGKRMALPLPDCAASRTACTELSLINQLDGFALQPRARVVFTGPIDPNTLREGIFFLWLDPSPPGEAGLGTAGKLTPINEVVYDPATYTAYAKPDEFFDQSRRYALLVTRAVRSASGIPIEAEEGFTACLAGRVGGEYCRDMADVAKLYNVSATRGELIGGSHFTTMSVTASLAAARRALAGAPVPYSRPARPLYRIAELETAIWRVQANTSGERFRDIPFPAPLSLLTQIGVGAIAFGSYQSPRLLTEQQVIPQTPTARLVTFTGTEEIQFHVFLPAAPKPSSGYPVAIVGHGLGDSRFGLPTVATAGLIAQGFAVIAISAVGHGYGPESQFLLQERGGSTITLPGGGRGIDLNRDGRIDTGEGCTVVTAEAPVLVRDCLRQTALDLMQLTRLLRQGVDLDGDGTTDLDRQARIGYLGQSLGSFYGSLLLAVEPEIEAGVLNVGSGSAILAARFNPALRDLLRLYLEQRLPGFLPAGAALQDELPLRYEPVRILQTPNAPAIQEAISRLEWLETQGMPAAYATHFAASTLPGVPIKRVLFQFAYGDQTIPNPATSQLIRAANRRERSQFYRFDRVRQRVPQADPNPHTYLAGLVSTSPQETAVAFAALTQAGLYLASTADEIPNVNTPLRLLFGFDVFEVPTLLPGANQLLALE